MTERPFDVHRLTPAIGAEIAGLDLSAPLPQPALDALYTALIEHQVIFLREQSVSPDAHLALARSFGEPQPPHPKYPHLSAHEQIVVLRNGPDNPPDTAGWHTDVTFYQEPPFASLLIAREVPDCGGDTLWVSLARAYETLPGGIRADLEEMRAIHDLGDFRNDFALNATDGAGITEAHQRFGSAIHPVVRTHPVSGRKHLYVNESFTQHIVGLRAAESNRLLDYLYRHIDQPEHQVRFRWTAGAMAIWDNRCTSHYAASDYLPHTREMHRITVARDARADRPVNR